MNGLSRALAQANAVRVRLGEGEPGLYPLLGGFGGEADDGGTNLGGGATGAVSRVAILRRDVRLAGIPGHSTGGTGGSLDPTPGCPAVESFLPGGKRAGDVVAGDEIQLVDPRTGARRMGVVSFSAAKMQLCFRVEWKNGVALVCSDTAPLPIADGSLRIPLEVCGEQTLTEVDGGLVLSPVISVRRVGLRWVQHITCENACFLVGAVDGHFALHHNKLRPDGGP